jgi:hypothetical protein
MRDFVKDVRAGQVNVSNEDIATYGLDVSGYSEVVPQSGTLKWAAANVRVAERLFSEGLNALRKCSSLRYKIIVAVLIAKYQTYVQDLRRNRFNVYRAPRVRARRFFKNIVANLHAVFVAHRTNVEPKSAFPQSVQPAPWAHARFVFSTLPAANRDGLKDLRRTLEPVSTLIDDIPRMDRRFRGGYSLGQNSCIAIAPVFARMTAISHTAGLIVAYWGLSAIEIDRLQDEMVLSSTEIVQLSEHWLDALQSALDLTKPRVPMNVMPGNPAHVFSLLSDRFMVLVREIYGNAAVHASSRHALLAQKEFFEKAGFLMRGQMTSMGQTSLESPKEWSWYYREIMNHKNVEFLLTPFRLWCVEVGSAERFERVASSFLLLNACYSHYQLLDDIADIREDMQQGVIAAPGFILLSQASLGTLYGELCPRASRVALDPAGACRIADAVDHSDLLCPEFLKAPLYDGVRHALARWSSTGSSGSSAEMALRCGLSNTVSDLTVPLSELAWIRSQQGTAYLEGLRAGDLNAARRELLESQVACRILATVGEDAAVAEMANELRGINDPAHINILYIMERLMRRTLGAAATVARGRQTATAGLASAA